MAYLKFDLLAGAGKEVRLKSLSAGLTSQDPSETHHYISNILLRHRAHVASDPWRGLPELTNSDGKYCHDSCRTQAWSASTILDVLEEMYKMGKDAQ
jgi:glycogen debranching enzyme